MVFPDRHTYDENDDQADLIQECSERFAQFSTHLFISKNIGRSVTLDWLLTSRIFAHTSRVNRGCSERTFNLGLFLLLVIGL